MKMHWALLTGLLMSAVAVFAFFQPKPVRATIATPDARCVDCKRIIEAVAPKYADGLVTINVIYQRGITQVSYYKERTNIEVLKAAIATAGFKADNVQPRTEEVAKLPACCQPKPQPADSTQN
jgi:periplasmic mercuric ion binding protein